jgi:hypothetical protein
MWILEKKKKEVTSIKHIDPSVTPPQIFAYL